MVKLEVCVIWKTTYHIETPPVAATPWQAYDRSYWERWSAKAEKGIISSGDEE